MTPEYIDIALAVGFVALVAAIWWEKRKRKKFYAEVEAFGRSVGSEMRRIEGLIKVRNQMKGRRR